MIRPFDEIPLFPGIQGGPSADGSRFPLRDGPQ